MPMSGKYGKYISNMYQINKFLLVTFTLNPR